ncbi:helix-turn-helix transcriptional regulator [Williamsia deligens]|uniref:helix-turn-helix transcriptional regulator n=1 Tax=Williamsia deligens TaxID=321325 RepID=UPI0026467F4F|nr:Helix-turn-helix domain-containing protein [Williamsia deligens]
MQKELQGTSSRSAEDVRVGNTLRVMREMRGYRPDDFASSIGISRPYLANIEAGRKHLTDVLLARAAKALDVPQIAIRRPDVVLDEVAV